MRVNDMTVEQLKAELKSLDLSVAGNKKELRERLCEALQSEGLNPDEFEFVLETSLSEGEKEESVEKQMLDKKLAVVNENKTVSSGNFDMMQFMFSRQQMLAGQQLVTQQMLAEQKTMKNEKKK